MSTHTHGPAPRSTLARSTPTRAHSRPARPRHPTPDVEGLKLAARRLLLLAMTALLVARLTSAFAGIVVCVAGLAALAAHAAARAQ